MWLNFIVCYVVVAFVYFTLGHRENAQKRRRGLVCAVLAVPAIMFWLVSSAFFVIELSDEARQVRGFRVQESVLDDIQTGAVEGDPEALLRAYGWRSPEDAWGSLEVALVRTLLVFFFTTPFALVAASLSCYALQEPRHGE